MLQCPINSLIGRSLVEDIVYHSFDNLASGYLQEYEAKTLNCISVRQFVMLEEWILVDWYISLRESAVDHYCHPRGVCEEEETTSSSNPSTSQKGEFHVVSHQEIGINYE